MKKHKWSQQDHVLLEKNVKKYGLTSGCKKTSQKISVSEKACVSMYYKFKKLTEHGIKIDHPEKVEEAKRKLAEEQSAIPETNNTVKYKRWTREETDILKNNVLEHGYGKGVLKTSSEINKSLSQCVNKVRNLSASGFEYNKRKCASQQEEEEIARYLKDQISKNPGNLSDVFKKTADKFGFKHSSPIVARWYGNRGFSNKPSCRENMGFVFSLLGDNATVNKKNTNKMDVSKTKKLFEKIVVWFKKKMKTK